MPKPSKFRYEKKLPFRDAFYFIIVCEGQSREPDYFKFFEGISSRVKIVPVGNYAGSAPNKLIAVAIDKEKELDAQAERDQTWFVIDTDRWREQLHKIRLECENHPHWHISQSNPCFEVWLYFHATSNLPVLTNPARCSDWKSYLPTAIEGGFNADFHPVAIETAIRNAKIMYSENGYFPNPGSTQLWQLGEELLPLIKRDLEALKHKFPTPKIIE